MNQNHEQNLDKSSHELNDRIKENQNIQVI